MIKKKISKVLALAAVACSAIAFAPHGTVANASQTTGVVTAKSGLNLRKSASTSAKIIKTIPHNGQVNIKSKSGNWYNVEHNGSKGYVSADYIQKGSASLSNTQNNATSKYDKILSAMKSQLGKKYCYGGSSPSTGFDCSGLMQWGFRQVGINIGRTTYDQINNGDKVSLSNLQPGDLLFNKDITHVGMYVGNGQWIEAPNSNADIRVVAVPWSRITEARRVIK